MTRIDEHELATVLAALPDVLEEEEAELSRATPSLSASEAFDVALRRSLARLRFELNQETFERLRWKLSMIRAENRLVRAAATIALNAAEGTAAWSSALRDSRTGHPSRQSRTIRGPSGLVWTISVIDALTPIGSRRGSCLVFSSEETVTCVWDFPEEWFSLSDQELDELRQRHTRS